MQVTISGAVEAVLTTDHPQSSYGIPVLVQHWRVYGPDDLILADIGDETHLIPARDAVRRCIPVYPPLPEVDGPEFVDPILTLPAGPRVDTSPETVAQWQADNRARAAMIERFCR